jgi:hypothetical protein
MREYPKIDTLYERLPDHTISDILKRPVLASLNPWIVTEKIHGMNIRVHLSPDNQVMIHGRTDNAQLPADLVKALYDTLPAEKLAALRKDADPVSITLYGEGYGAGIQKGSHYRADKGFILFDVLIDDRWWLKDEDVTGIAERLGILRVPLLGYWSLTDIRDAVKEGIISRAATAAPAFAEGIVARPLEPLFDAAGKRIIIKLKTHDFGGRSA